MTFSEKDEIQDWLRDLGQPVNPDATVIEMPPLDRSAGVSLIVLELVKQDVVPPYCIHGYASCVQCHLPVWLGHETVQVVQSGEAVPICQQCANSDIPPESVLERQVHDHLRKDGPHE